MDAVLALHEVRVGEVGQAVSPAKCQNMSDVRRPHLSWSLGVFGVHVNTATAESYATQSHPLVAASSCSGEFRARSARDAGRTSGTFEKVRKFGAGEEPP